MIRLKSLFNLVLSQTNPLPKYQNFSGYRVLVLLHDYIIYISIKEGIFLKVWLRFARKTFLWPGFEARSTEELSNVCQWLL